MDYINGMDKPGSGKINQLMVTDYLVEQAQLITNDVKALSYLINTGNAQSGAVLDAILRSENDKASELLDSFTVQQLTDLRRAATNLAMMCNRKLVVE